MRTCCTGIHRGWPGQPCRHPRSNNPSSFPSKMVESNLYFYSVAVPVWFLKLTPLRNKLLSSHWEAQCPYFSHPPQWTFGNVATRWDDDHPLQHVYIISFLQTSLKLLCHLNVLTRFLVGMVTKVFHLCHACRLSGYGFDQDDYKANTYRLDHPESIALLL